MIYKPVLSCYVYGARQFLCEHLFSVNITAVFNFCAH